MIFKRFNKKISYDNCFPDIPEKKPNSNDIFYIDVFGIRLEFDDILLICILIFLYEENVDDTMLFIALILLLLS